jgi:N-methylhydantoinase A/oxoprolinase/acetone carboxylase beta subunit
MVNIKLAASLPPSPAAGKIGEAEHGSSTVTRRLYLPLEREFAEVPVVPRGALRPGETVTGPALIEEPDTTTYLGRGDVVQATPSGELMVSVHIPSATA